MSAGTIIGTDPRISAELRLAGETKRGSLVAFVHGGGCSGRYFDLKGRSCAQAAVMRGHHVLLVDRPGYGGSAPPATDAPIGEAAVLLIDLVGIAAERSAAKSIAIIGQSIGGAVAIETAARRPPWPLAALCVSGIGAHLTPESQLWLEAVLGGALPERKAEYFLGPDGTYDWRALTALQRAGEPWQPQETIEVMRDWPVRFAATAVRVAVPVHVRLAEHERIWDNSPAALRAIASPFPAGADVGLLPDGGHLYEVHKRGPELIAAQLDFIETHSPA